ncbi:MAG: hypothetical protein PSU93_09270 [Methylobacter sp.]|uniref:Uncharacterized protein n=1 Tax=Candidatus Methylobacter titanis TaxID=3053457 RepID=A0AA43TPZ5_9GAMM|nr:hypothetical protein [Candidatus Methylobacter titanis]
MIAIIRNNTVVYLVDVIDPEIRAEYVDVPVDGIVTIGDSFVNGKFGTPLPKPAVVPPIVSVINFKMLFTGAERVAISSAKATDPVIADFYSILDDLRTVNVDLALTSVQGMLDYLVSKTLLTAARKAAILTGVLS